MHCEAVIYFQPTMKQRKIRSPLWVKIELGYVYKWVSISIWVFQTFFVCLFAWLRNDKISARNKTDIWSGDTYIFADTLPFLSQTNKQTNKGLKYSNTYTTPLINTPQSHWYIINIVGTWHNSQKHFHPQGTPDFLLFHGWLKIYDSLTLCDI